MLCVACYYCFLDYNIPVFCMCFRSGYLHCVWLVTNVLILTFPCFACVSGAVICAVCGLLLLFS